MKHVLTTRSEAAEGVAKMLRDPGQLLNRKPYKTLQCIGNIRGIQDATGDSKCSGTHG